MVELGLGFLTPFFLLLVVGVSPAVAGIALIPATVPIILAGPLAGRAFDRFGGCWPLVAGFCVLSLSGLVLALGVSQESAVALIPGLLLQGLGLGIVLTVNDPTGLTAVPPEDSGEAAGIKPPRKQIARPDPPRRDRLPRRRLPGHLRRLGRIALLGALACLVLVRRSDRVAAGPVFGRRSRWVASGEGRSPAITRRPRESL
jgi:hypothetical protein